ncbi:hypothetical protein CVT26_013632 [Gymnopilus dilepis]|uniref:Uncharacterized protein n=1 Tax=Gymnopilus dilepis TaxID=231916 RepID=A0A409Y5T1_9AGAR|nr:hypothetical protein CVT26_013632 [Gymnopilus dilepis]
MLFIIWTSHRRRCSLVKAYWWEYFLVRWVERCKGSQPRWYKVRGLFRGAMERNKFTQDLRIADRTLSEPRDSGGLAYIFMFFLSSPPSSCLEFDGGEETQPSAMQSSPEPQERSGYNPPKIKPFPKHILTVPQFRLWYTREYNRYPDSEYLSYLVDEWGLLWEYPRRVQTTVPEQEPKEATGSKRVENTRSKRVRHRFSARKLLSIRRWIQKADRRRQRIRAYLYMKRQLAKEKRRFLRLEGNCVPVSKPMTTPAERLAEKLASELSLLAWYRERLQKNLLAVKRLAAKEKEVARR